MPNTQKGFSGILIILLIIFLAGGGYLVYKNFPKFSQQPDKSSQNEPQEIKPKSSEVPNNWQTFDYKYGQMRINYPPNWLVKYDINRMSNYRPVDFIPPQKGSVITVDNIVSLNVYVGRKPYYPESSASAQYYQPPAPRNNFNLPTLGEGMNAFFSQQSNSTAIYFTRNGIDYVLTADIAKALEQKMDPAEITSILTQMAKSVQFTQELGSCDDPVLQPLKTFPDNFTLSNYHDSDKSDIPTGYWPNVTLIGNYNDVEGLQQKAKYSSKRYFLVSYEKDGNPFTSDSAFEKNIVLIEGGDFYSASSNQTIITYVNCIDSMQKGYPIEFFYIGNDDLNSFEISAYGASDNPQKLWSVEKWNTSLLKKTRGTVYIKMENRWQKYTSKNFYTAI